MPDMQNWKEFGNVGQDKPDHDVTDAYDKRYGEYEHKPHGISPGQDKPNDQITPPFTITGR